MPRTRKLLVAVGLFLFGAAAGGVGLYYWSMKGLSQRMENLVLATLIPGQSKEVSVLIQVVQGLENRPLNESKMALCRLLDIKVAIMAANVRTLAESPTFAQARSLNEYASRNVPSADQIEKSTQCEKEWLPNITLQRTPE